MARTEPIEPQHTKWGHNHEFSDLNSDDSYDRDHFHTIRPSHLEKLAKRFDGSGDPHDHIAAFRQVLYAEQVRDVHTQVEGFGLTLQIKALDWFQTLESTSKLSLAQLENSFIVTFSRLGLKHNLVAQIYSFQQHENETMRECVGRLRMYIIRCLEDRCRVKGA